MLDWKKGGRYNETALVLRDSPGRLGVTLTSTSRIEVGVNRTMMDYLTAHVKPNLAGGNPSPYGLLAYCGAKT